MALALREANITLHEPVLARFSIRNALRKPIHFSIDNDSLEGFELAVVPPTGDAVRQPLIVPGFHVGGTTTLQPGQEYRKEIVLSRWYAFPNPGRYKIVAEMAPPIYTEGQKLIRSVASETLWLEVKPRDADRLKQACESLSQAVLHGPDTAAKWTAMLALAYVRDPVAIPYLREVAVVTEADYRSPAVKGLALIAEVEGLESVLSALGPDRQRLEPEVRQALKFLQLHISATD
jgi:hypothetical protein